MAPHYSTALHACDRFDGRLRPLITTDGKQERREEAKKSSSLVNCFDDCSLIGLKGLAGTACIFSVTRVKRRSHLPGPFSASLSCSCLCPSYRTGHYDRCKGWAKGIMLVQTLGPGKNAGPEAMAQHPKIVSRARKSATLNVLLRSTHGRNDGLNEDEAGREEERELVEIEYSRRRRPADMGTHGLLDTTTGLTR